MSRTLESSRLQRLVDGLATRVGRPALLEDHHQRVIAYSEHEDPGDDVRRHAILRRRSPEPAIRWWRQFGIADAVGPVRVPGNAELGVLARVCVPVRHGAALLGHLWFVDPDASMTDAEIDVAAQAAPELAVAMHRELVADRLSLIRELEAARDLLLGDAAARSRAAAELAEGGHFASARPVTAIVGRPPGDLGDDLQGSLEDAVTAVTRRLPPREALCVARGDHAVVLCSALHPAAVDEAVAALDAALATALGEPPVIGVGDPRPSLEAATDSYEEARLAADMAARGAGGRIARWSELGIYRLLARLPADERLHPGLERLLAGERELTLLHTLETYLDLAGNVHASAERLCLHRASLYYRLNRIEQLADTDLRDGNERLALHLALKLARLHGRLPAAEPEPVGV